MKNIKYYEEFSDEERMELIKNKLTYINKKIGIN